LIAALLIDPLLLLIAFCIVVGLFLYARKRSLTITFGDARRGYIFEHLRRYLLKLSSMPQDPKNWRPQLLVLAGRDEKHKTLIRTGALLNNERGILSVLRIIDLPQDSELVSERRRELTRMRKELAELRTDYFPEIIAVTGDFDFDAALNVYLQSRAIGPMALNIVLCGWPVHEERIKAFFLHLRTIRQLRMSSLLLLNPERMPVEACGTIDVWWRGRRNGSLMLILAYLLSCNKGWRHCPIRLLRIAAPEGRAAALRELAALREEARIEAEQIVISDGSDFETAFVRESSSASMIFLGYLPPGEEDIPAFHGRISRLTGEMPAMFLVTSAGDTDLDS